MTTIEKIKAEIERMIDSCKTKNGFPRGTYSAIRIETLEGALAFIDTLETEKPVPNDLEEAAGLYLDNHKPLTRYNWGDLMDAFKAGAEWQKEQDDKELSDLLTIAHLQGAEQMNEQMMKEAVEGEVIKTDKHTSVRYKSYYGTDRYFYGIANKQLKPGDKVRIIIVKEDEK